MKGPFSCFFLHDRPARAIFCARPFGHGCTRLSDRALPMLHKLQVRMERTELLEITEWYRQYHACLLLVFVLNLFVPGSSGLY